MELRSFPVLYTIFCILIGLKEHQSWEVPCKEFEVIVCGDEDSEWKICTPKTFGVRRIVTAQLDTRYRNRYCRRYGTPENFGLSSSGRSMWTVGWCYGTFFLCLEMYHPSESRENNELIASSQEQLGEGTTTSLGYDTTSSATSESISTGDNTSNNSTESDYSEEEFIVETGPLETDEYMANDEYFDLLVATENNTLGGDNQELVYYELDPRMKFWLIFGIVGGGIIVVILICTVAYLTIQCCDDSNTADDSTSKQSTRSSRKYYRPQKWSTSALVASEPENFSDVYDFIPATKLAPSASVKTENETHGNQNLKQINRNTNKEYVGQDKTEESSSLNDTTTLHNNNPSKRNDYFILTPQALDSANENENGVIYTDSSENIYDHLVHTPKTSVSDSSTYHCLTFQRDGSRNKSDTESSSEEDNTSGSNVDPNVTIEQYDKDFKVKCNDNNSNDTTELNKKDIDRRLVKEQSSFSDEAIKAKADTKRGSYKTVLSERTNVLHTEI